MEHCDGSIGSAARDSRGSAFGDHASQSAEGLALGGILRASMQSRSAALAGCALAEGTTLVGGVLGLMMAPHLGSQWITYPLGLAAGWLAYLGSHAVHEAWKRCGPTSSFAWALTGMAGAAALQRGAEALFR